MKVKNQISVAIISASVALLSPFVPNLTPTRLIAALEEYDIDGNKKSSDNERPKQPYTIAEVCQLLRISKPTVYRLREQGKISFLKIGRSTRILAEDVERLLNRGK